MKTQNKKAQHEMVGFVLIIIIVSIIGLVFLSFAIGKGESVKKTSVEISDFLQSSLYYTTPCASGYVPNYEDLQGLIKSCYRNKKCFNEEMACDVLEESFSEIVSESFQVSEAGKNKAYELNIYYRDLYIKEDEEILVISDGNFANCSSSAGSSQAIFMDSGNINVELEMCYG